MPKICLLALLLAAPALAQRPPVSPAPKVQRFDFDNDVVEADRSLPAVEMVLSRGPSRHASLIRVRTTFVPEMLKSAAER